MTERKSVDKFLLFNVAFLVIFGLIIFLSASLGLLAREGVKYSSVALSQIGFGLIGGGLTAYFASKISYRLWRRYSFWIFLGSLILTILVFIPGTGFEFSGAKRWVYVGPVFFQPSEFLKIAYIIYLAAWLSMANDRVKSFRYGTLPFLIISSISVGILFLQPDNTTAIIMLITGGVMYFSAGANLKHIILVGIICILAVGSIIVSRPYALERVKTYLDPSSNSLTSGYQIQQSLIAIGSGGLFGRGFGQSVQKFNFLPEPIGDSIFAVASEEFGFLGSFFLVLAFITFLFRSIKLSLSARDSFGGLLMLGLAILIVSQSFINMASMLGIFPLSGLPLLFVSHGGSALFFTLFAVGIMLNISKFKRT